MFTNVYRENNAITSKLPVATPIIGQKFVSLLNGNLTVGALPSLQHLGVSVDSVVTGDCDYIVSGHVRVEGANFTVGAKVAANKYGYIGTLDTLESGSLDRIGGNIYIIGFALTTDTFLLQIDHTKPLVSMLVEGRKYMLELFSELDYKAPSIAFPAVCISRLHPSDTKAVTLLDTNWIEFVPALRALQMKVGANSPDIPYTSFVPGVFTEIVLNPANSGTVNTDLLETIEDMIRYYNDLDSTAALTGAHFLNLHLTVNFKGDDARIVDINRITETITIDYDSSAITTDAGNVQIYPHRLASIFGNTAAPDNLGKAQLRKLTPETSISSGFSSSQLRQHRLQSHLHKVKRYSSVGNNIIPTTNTYIAGNGPLVTSAGTPITGNEHEIDIPMSDGVNGNINSGKTSRGNLMTAYIYVFGGRYVP